MSEANSVGETADAATTATTKAMKRMLILLVVVEVTSGFVQGFYSPLLPEIAKHVHVASESMSWFQTVQAIAAAVSVPLLSRLGDLYGPRRVLRGAIIAVLLGTLLIALVPSYNMVLLGRVLIGPLGVWLPLAIALIYAHTAGESATRSISILSASLMGGIVLGTIAAGVLSAAIPSLVVVLLMPALLVVVSAAIVFFALPEGTNLAKAKIDWVGFGGLAVIMVAFIVALAYVGPSHAALSATMFGVSVIATFLWLKWEKKAKFPAVDLSLVFSPGLGLLYVAGMLLGIVMIDGAPALSDFLSHDPDVYAYGFGAGTGLIAEMITVMLMAATAGAFASSFLGKRFGMRATLVTASVLAAAGQLALIPFHSALLVFWFTGLATGLGMGVLVGAMPALVAQSAPRDRTGIATGLYNALVAMGGAVGGAAFKLSLSAFKDDTRLINGVKMVGVGGYMTIWGISALVFVAIALIMLKVEMPEVVTEESAGTEAR